MLNLLSGLVASGAECTIPKHLLNWDINTDDKLHQYYIITLRLSQPDCSDSEYKKYAKWIIDNFDAYPDYISLLINMMEKQNISLEKIASFLLELKSQMIFFNSGELHEEIAPEIQETLIKIMNNRPSQLNKAEIWKSLELPQVI